MDALCQTFNEVNGCDLKKKKKSSRSSAQLHGHVQNECAKTIISINKSKGDISPN